MRVIRSIKGFAQEFKRPVLTMGIFDGVHLAHQKIIRETVRQARTLKGRSIVLTFKPHPLKNFKGLSASSMITSLERRISLIRRFNVDACLVLDFNKRFSQIRAQDFIKRFLVDAIGVNYVIIGEGFRFGRNRNGSFFLLKKLSKIYGFKTRQIKTLKLNGQIVSSSKIRSLIQKGKLKQANRFLGRNLSICGRIKKGSARGRILGYPTANMEPPKGLVPLNGVYAVFIRLNNQIFPGILNIGIRPTFSADGDCNNIIEAHIFDFCNQIYGKEMQVFFIQRIRSEKKFVSKEALLKQIRKDEIKAKKALRSIKPPPIQAPFNLKI